MPSRKSSERVVVIGGGVAGLSAAHELAERGFEVHVYERRTRYGGKAASVVISGQDNPSQTGPRGLTGEHGFRFFPGWYRHLPDTMKRIPYRDRTVYDNLVPADVNLLCAYDRDPVRALLRLPTSWKEVKTIASFPGELARLGLTVDDFRFFLSRLWSFLTASEERRVREYDAQTWWEFMQADDRSREFRDYLVVSLTRNTVAAKPKDASAYTIAKVALQTIFDTLTPETLFDRVLNGPTNEVWIDPWVEYLRGLGVRFYQDAELESIEIEDRHITAVRFTRTQTVRNARVRQAFLAAFTREEAELKKELRNLVAAVEAKTPLPSGQDPQYLLEVIDGAWPSPDADAPYDCLDGTTDDGWGREREAAIRNLSAANLTASTRAAVGERLRSRLARYSAIAVDEAYQAASAVIAQAEEEAVRPVEADYYVFALPVEQMAYYVTRSETLQQYDPSLRNIVLLSEHVDWMAGIQFYLKDVVNITRGHIDLLDSEWALTAISQAQFWKDIDLRDRGEGTLRGQVRSILSVDISAWDIKGSLLRKEAYNCTRSEIAREVWHQLKAALNRPGRVPVLTDEMLVDAGRPRSADELPPDSYYLDDSIVDRLDRKRQAIYDKFRSVHFSAAELLRKQANRGEASEASYMYGAPQELNAEPLLVNRVGSYRLRPTTKTAIANMFLAADYVRTNTHLATMEAANEAARAAVNEILTAAGSREPRCEIWPLAEPLEVFRRIDEVLFRRGQRFEDSYGDIPVRVAAGMATAATRVVSSAIDRLLTRKR